MGLYLVLYYIFKKSSKIIDKDERKIWINYRLRPLVIIGILFEIAEVIALLFIFISDQNKK